MQLSVENLTLTYANHLQALAEMSLQAHSGECICIVGPSGCGKSTLLRVIAGLIPPTQGRISINKTQARIGLMFQDAALLPWRTVRDNIALPFELSRAPIDASAIDDMLRLVGLSDFAVAYPRELSGGMAQRVALARTLIQKPDLLLLDEPFGALDTMTREHLTQALERILCEAKITTVMVTHSISEAVFLADRVLVMSPRPGRITADVPIDLPRPRMWDSARVAVFQSQVRAQLSKR